MATYQTEQRNALIQFLSNHSEHSFTIEEIAARMQQDKIITNSPGKSTIYRLMPKLIKEDIVKRFVKEHSRQFLYQIAGCEHYDLHLHMKCVICGRLLHMEDEVSETILRQILCDSNFSVNTEQTILFGNCAKCR